MTQEYVPGKAGGIFIQFPKSISGYRGAQELLKLLKMSLDEELQRGDGA